MLKSIFLLSFGFILNSSIYAQTNTFPTSGNVGVGTTSPQVPLHVVGSGVSADAGNANVYSGNLSIQANTGGRTTNTGAELEFVIPAASNGTNFWGQGRIITVAGDTVNGDAVGKMIFGTRRYFNKLGTGVQWYYGNDLVIDGTGKIGIGTTTPQYALDIAGASRAQGLNIVGSSVNTNNTVHFYRSDNALMAYIGWQTEGNLNSPWYFNSTNGNDIAFAVSGTESVIFKSSGNVGIGTVNPQSLLAVSGNITAKQVTVTQTGWSDFVFDSSYQRMSLENVSHYVNQYKHLPQIPSTAEIEKAGLDLGAMQKLHMQKIEELTLYAIDADKHAKQQDLLIAQQQAMLLQFQERLKSQQQEIEELRKQVKGQQ